MPLTPVAGVASTQTLRGFLDNWVRDAHTDVVSEAQSSRRRVFIEDVRRDNTFMRVTWHPENNVFVVTHWRGVVCIAATRIPVDAVPPLVDVLVHGLADAGATAARAASATPPASPDVRPPRPRRGFVERLRIGASRWRSHSRETADRGSVPPAPERRSA